MTGYDLIWNFVDAGLLDNESPGTVPLALWLLETNQFIMKHMTLSDGIVVPGVLLGQIFRSVIPFWLALVATLGILGAFSAIVLISLRRRYLSSSRHSRYSAGLKFGAPGLIVATNSATLIPNFRISDLFRM